MNIQQKLTGQLTKTTVGKRVISEQRYRMVLSAAVSLSFHFLYALYHGVLGVVHSSLWFITMCAYYAILCVFLLFYLNIKTNPNLLQIPNTL